MIPSFSYAIFPGSIDYATNMSYLLCNNWRTTMKTKDELEQELAAVRAEYRKVASILDMMQKGTKMEDLARMKREQLEPLKAEIRRLEQELRK